MGQQIILKQCSVFITHHGYSIYEHFLLINYTQHKILITPERIWYTPHHIDFYQCDFEKRGLKFGHFARLLQASMRPYWQVLGTKWKLFIISIFWHPYLAHFWLFSTKNWPKLLFVPGNLIEWPTSLVGTSNLFSQINTSIEIYLSKFVWV